MQNQQKGVAEHGCTLCSAQAAIVSRADSRWAAVDDALPKAQANSVHFAPLQSSFLQRAPLAAPLRSTPPQQMHRLHERVESSAERQHAARRINRAMLRRHCSPHALS